jgi:hypothetical protein
MTALKYRKKPQIVEAVQWFPDRKVDGVVPIPLSTRAMLLNEKNFTDEELGKFGYVPFAGCKGSGWIVKPGDWILTQEGERFAVSGDEFLEFYEPDV